MFDPAFNNTLNNILIKRSDVNEYQLFCIRNYKKIAPAFEVYGCMYKDSLNTDTWLDKWFMFEYENYIGFRTNDASCPLYNLFGKMNIRYSIWDTKDKTKYWLK